MALDSSVILVQAAAVAVLTIITGYVKNMAALLHTAPYINDVPCIGIFLGFFAMWLYASVSLVTAHSHRVIVRKLGANSATLREGSFWLFFPEYLLCDSAQFGPWSKRLRLPLVGQVLDIDVPEVCVPVDNGIYCLKVNTKIAGVVENYSAEDLVQNPVSLEQRCHDVIAHALRREVYEKTLEEALVVIQRIFLKDSASISSSISVPAFRVTELRLDANERISPADEATKTAMEIVVQRKQEAAKCAALEASLETEGMKAKLHRVSLETTRNEVMLQQEAYGKEGAALIEAAKHAKALYLFSGGHGANAGTVISLPS